MSTPPFFSLRRAGAARLLAWLAALIVLTACFSSPAGAKVITVGGHAYGVSVAASSAAPAHTRPASGPALGQPPLLYRGGPVDHQITTRAIYWAAGGHTIPTTFTTGLDTFLGDFAASATANGNIASVARQYVDADGRALSALTNTPPIADADPYPASGCTPSSPATVCLTNTQVEAELASLIASRGMPTGLNNSYIVVMPSDVQVCLAAGTCVPGVYCAYHNDFIPNDAADTTFTVLGVPSGGGCESVLGPHNDPALDGAETIEGHELVETATDPQVGAGYVDAAGNEIGDDCSWQFGATTPAGAGQYNQVLGGHQYLLQEMWSNQGATCAPSLASPAALNVTATGGSSATAATLTAALHGDSASASYQWQFLSASGSAGSASGSGPSVSLVFPALGSYVVWATATDSAGNSIVGATRVALPLSPPPTASFTYAPSAPLTGSPVAFDASASACASVPCSYAWSDDGSPTRPGSVLWPLGSGQRMQFTFQGAGVKYVRLVITDALGRSATIEHNLTVSAPAPPVPQPPTTPPPSVGPPTNPPPTAPPPSVHHTGPPSTASTGSSADASGGTLGSSASGVLAPSPAQLRALLSPILSVHGRSATIAALLRNGGYLVRWTAPSAGHLTVVWYETGPHGRRILIARAGRSFGGPRKATFVIALTPAARRLLRSAQRVTLSATASFGPAGAPATSIQRGFTLTR
jgi:hypothetical protein